MEEENVLSNPDIEEVAELINNGSENSEYVSVIGLCRVDYDGRTSTTLGYGDRHLILKSDGTVLIHLDEKKTAKNYQPPGASYEARVTDKGTLHVHAEREVSSETADLETVDIEFTVVYSAVKADMEDEADFVMQGSEDDVQDHLYDDPQPISDELGSFIPHSKEYKLDVGSVDIFGHTDEGDNVVVELKRRRVGPDAVQQLRRYVEEIDSTHSGDVIGVLVAPALTDSAQKMAEDNGFKHVPFTPNDAVPSIEKNKNQTLDNFVEE